MRGPAEAQCQLGVPSIKISVQGAASGPHADYGRQIEMGATMAIEEINAGGGILGCRLETKFMDDENKAATGVKNARYLVTEWGGNRKKPHRLKIWVTEGKAVDQKSRLPTPPPRRSL